MILLLPELGSMRFYVVRSAVIERSIKRDHLEVEVPPLNHIDLVA